MKLVTVRYNQELVPGRVMGEEIALFEGSTMRELLADPNLSDRAKEAASSTVIGLSEADLAPVVPDPDKIVCVGVNYLDHIEEMGREKPSAPTYFAKFRSALIGANDDIVLPVEASSNVDWECEMAVVIGTKARNVSPDNALAHIAGFTVLNDVSVRDWQRRTSQFLAGKTFEALTPVGPWLVTPDEAGDGSDLTIRTIVNGITKQQSNTSNLVFDALAIVADLSQITTLEPGDIIATGTPGGVGAARTPPEFLSPGDELITEIDGIGQLKNLCT